VNCPFLHLAYLYQKHLDIMPTSRKSSMSTRSKEAHHGSVSSTSTSASSHSQQSRSVAEPDFTYLIDQYAQHSQRDHKSYAVAEYDPYQEAARSQHWQELKDVVDKAY